MPTTPLVTQRDVARACNLHPSTVCLALGNSPAIPEPTRVRVQETARQLGYQPNAAARNLASLRTDRRSATLPLAWINQEPARDAWHTHPEMRSQLAAASRRAFELGYHFDEFWALEPGMTPARLAQIVHARGIEGVIFPVSHSMRSTLVQSGWDAFSNVSFNDHRMDLAMDVVCPDYYYNATLALEQLADVARERVGMFLSTAFDAATQGLVCSRFLRYQSELPAMDRIPVGLVDGSLALRVAHFRTWFERYRPEYVVCRDHELARELSAEIDPSVFIQLSVAEKPELAGIDECAERVAAIAVDCVVDKIRRFEKGLGGHTRRHVIKGAWQGRVVDEPVAAVA